MPCVMCPMSLIILFIYSFSFSDHAVKLEGGGSVINGAYPVFLSEYSSQNVQGARGSALWMVSKGENKKTLKPLMIV